MHLAAEIPVIDGAGQAIVHEPAELNLFIVEAYRPATETEFHQ